MTDLVEGTGLVAKDGRASGEMARWMKGQTRAAAAITSSLAATSAALSNFGWPIFIEFPDDKAYRVCLKSPIAFTIDSVTTRSTSGTCTVTVSIDGVNLGGTANSVSTTESTQAHTTNNAVAVDADVTVTVTSNSAAENVAIMISGTRTL
jgi:hypothetical protein